MSYDDNNIFAKILRGEISCKKIYEDKNVLSFYDVNDKKLVRIQQMQIDGSVEVLISFSPEFDMVLLKSLLS